MARDISLILFSELRYLESARKTLCDAAPRLRVSFPIVGPSDGDIVIVCQFTREVQEITIMNNGRTTCGVMPPSR